MNALSNTDFDPALAEAVALTSWLPPEAPLAMPRQVLEADADHALLSALLRLIFPARRA